MTFWYHLPWKKEQRYVSKSKIKFLKYMIFWNWLLYMLWTIKVWSRSHFWKTDYEGRIQNPIEYKYLPSQVTAMVFKLNNHLVHKQTLNHLVPVWLNGWVFIYELSGCGFESCCCPLNFRYCTCFEQGVPWHSGNYRV